MDIVEPAHTATEAPTTFQSTEKGCLPSGPSLSKDDVANAFIEKALQANIDSDKRDYPSLDDETQRNISAKFRALHKRVKDEGYYQCRYSEYAKELVRYSIFFSLFLVTLRGGWYWTSAAFLGLFWVSIDPSVTGAL